MKNQILDGLTVWKISDVRSNVLDSVFPSNNYIRTQLCIFLKFSNHGSHSSSFRFVNIWPALFFTPRSVVRRAASLLSKVVDSLAPSITNVLVQGKQVSICFSGIHLITVAKVWGRTLNFKFCIL